MEETFKPRHEHDQNEMGFFMSPDQNVLLVDHSNRVAVAAKRVKTSATT